MSFSIIAIQINPCFPVLSTREHFQNSKFMTTGISSWQNTGNCVIITAEVQDRRGQVMLCMIQGREAVGTM